MTDTTDNEPSGAQRMFDDFAPALVGFTDDVLFGQVWTRPQLSANERSLITVAALTTSGSTDQLRFHLGLARDNGATEEELIEAITHLAFYAGWPKAMAAMTVAQRSCAPIARTRDQRCGPPSDRHAAGRGTRTHPAASPSPGPGRRR